MLNRSSVAALRWRCCCKNECYFAAGDEAAQQRSNKDDDGGAADIAPWSPRPLKTHFVRRRRQRLDATRVNIVPWTPSEALRVRARLQT